MAVLQSSSNMAVRCGILINIRLKCWSPYIACMNILGCSVTTCDEPVCGNLGLKTMSNKRDLNGVTKLCV